MKVKSCPLKSINIVFLLSRLVVWTRRLIEFKGLKIWSYFSSSFSIMESDNLVAGVGILNRNTVGWAGSPASALKSWDNSTENKDSLPSLSSRNDPFHLIHDIDHAVFLLAVCVKGHADPGYPNIKGRAVWLCLFFGLSYFWFVLGADSICIRTFDCFLSI